MADEWRQRVFRPVLDRLRKDAERHFNGGPLQLVPVAYYDRPASYLLRARVCHERDRSSRPQLFVKVFKPKPI
jgi:hypothetical protein